MLFLTKNVMPKIDELIFSKIKKSSLSVFNPNKMQNCAFPQTLIYCPSATMTLLDKEFQGL